MLVKLEEKDFGKYIDSIYELALDRSKSMYPIYSDGIKTKKDFVDKALKSFSVDDEEILLFVLDDIVLGWVHYYYLKDDNYFSAQTFQAQAHIDIMFKEFYEFAKQNYSGCDFYFGIPDDNITLHQELLNHNFKISNDCYNTVCFLKNYQPQSISNSVKKITKEEFSKFEVLHIVGHDEMYWNCERLYNHFDKWHIYIFEEDNITKGAIIFTVMTDQMAEIFCVDYLNNEFNEHIFSELVKQSLNTCKELYVHALVFFVEGFEHNSATKLGFTSLGKYLCFTKTL